MRGRDSRAASRLGALVTTIFAGAGLLLAALGPARRALRFDPLEALRAD